MVEVAVTLPEPRPEDDEDVVWGLSTAAALWARGERGDAIVWLRRAADAAATAGQEARAAELGIIAVRIERAHAELEPPKAAEASPEPPAPAAPPVRISTPPVSIPDPSAGDRLSGNYEEIDVEPIPPPPPVPHRPGTIRPPPSALAAPPLPPPSPLGIRAPSVSPPALAAPPAPAAAMAEPPRGPAPPVAPAEPPAPPAILGETPRPPENPKPPPHPEPPAPAPPPLAVQAAHAEPALPQAPAARPPSIPPPPPPARGPAPSSYPGVRKTAGPRVPILDPWADEPTLPTLRVEPGLRSVQLEGDEVVLQMRRSAPRIVEEDDGVITSAAPLDHTLRRGARPPTPPTRKWTATGEQPPGYIADASTGVPAKPGAKPRPAGSPPAVPHPAPAAQPSPEAQAVASTPSPAEPPRPPPPPETPKPPAQPAAEPLRSAPTVPAFMLGKSVPPSAAKPTPIAVPAKPRAPSAPPGPIEAARPASPAGDVHRPAAATIPSPTAVGGPPIGEPSKPLSPFEVPTTPTTPSPIPRPRRASVLPPPPAAEAKPGVPQGIPRPAAPAASPPSSASVRLRMPPSRPPPAQPVTGHTHPPETPKPPAQPVTGHTHPPETAQPVRTPPRPASASVRPPAPARPVTMGDPGRVPQTPPTPAAPISAPVTTGEIPTPSARGGLDAGALERVEAFADVPPEMRARLLSIARVDALGADDEVSGFGAALLIEGSASVCATIVDEPIARAQPDNLVPTRGTFTGAVALRVVAGPAGARVAVWDQAVLDDALRSCPWVLEELAARADRLQALAGATMGLLGELDEPRRDRVLERLAVHVAQAQEEVDTDLAVALVCVGSVEIQTGGERVVVRAGEVLFPRGGVTQARAGAQGALLLVGDAPPTSEDLAQRPSLVALFAVR